MINDKPLSGAVYGEPVDAEHRAKCPFCRAGIVMDFPSQVIAWAKSLAGNTGAEIAVFIVDKAYFKTRAQESGFHAMIAPWAKQCGYTLPELKQYLLGEIWGWTVSQIDGKPILVEPSTAKLSKAKYSELIEESMRIAAEKDDVYLIAPNEWREMKEKERKQQAKVNAAKAA